jgi:hypothetical protein
VPRLPERESPASGLKAGGAAAAGSCESPLAHLNGLLASVKRLNPIPHNLQHPEQRKLLGTGRSNRGSR